MVNMRYCVFCHRLFWHCKLCTKVELMKHHKHMKIPWFQLLKYFKYNFVFKFNDNNVKKSSFMHYATKCSPFCSYQSGLVLTQKCLHTQRRKKLAPFVWQFKTNQIVNYSQRPQSDDFVPSVRKLNHCHATYHYMLLFLTQSLLLHVLKLTTHTVSLCVCVCERERQKKQKQNAFICFCLGFKCLHAFIHVFVLCSVCVSVCICPRHHHSTPPTTGRVGERGEVDTMERLTSWHHKDRDDWLLPEAGRFISQPVALLSAASSRWSKPRR